MTDKFIARSTALAYRRLGAETIIMSAADSTLFSLNEVGSLIWEGADGKTPLSEIAARICSEFEISQEEARLDAENFVAQLSAEGLLRICDQNCSQPNPAAEEAT